MQVVRPTDGYASLAEQVIHWCIVDIKRKLNPNDKANNCYDKKNKYIACLFFTSDDCKEFWTGLAPHMIREFEKYEKVARDLLNTEFKDYEPRILNDKEKI